MMMVHDHSEAATSSTNTDFTSGSARQNSETMEISPRFPAPAGAVELPISTSPAGAAVGASSGWAWAPSPTGAACGADCASAAGATGARETERTRPKIASTRLKLMNKPHPLVAGTAQQHRFTLKT